MEDMLGVTNMEDMLGVTNMEDMVGVTNMEDMLGVTNMDDMLGSQIWRICWVGSPIRRTCPGHQHGGYVGVTNMEDIEVTNMKDLAPKRSPVMQSQLAGVLARDFN